MNLIEIAGHLGADPEERVTNSGKKVVSMRVAVRYRKEDTIWFRVTVWDTERYQRMLPYLKKGSAVIIVGELNKPDIYTNRDGVPQVSLEITAEIIRFSPFGKSTQSGESAAAPMGQVSVQPTTPSASSMATPLDMPVGAGMGSAPLDDDLPF